MPSALLCLPVAVTAQLYPLQQPSRQDGASLGAIGFACIHLIACCLDQALPGLPEPFQRPPINMAQYELSRTLAKFLDKHLCFPLLEFLQDRGVYSEEDILKSKIELLQNTNMVDFAMDIYKELYQTEDVPANMHERRAEVVTRLRTLQKAVEPIIGCLSNNNVIRNFRHVGDAAAAATAAAVAQQGQRHSGSSSSASVAAVAKHPAQQQQCQPHRRCSLGDSISGRNGQRAELRCCPNVCKPDLTQGFEHTAAMWSPSRGRCSSTTSVVPHQQLQPAASRFTRPCFALPCPGLACLVLHLRCCYYYERTHLVHAHRQDRAFNLHFLKEEFDIGPEQIDALYQFAKFQFDCGNYSSASELLQVGEEQQEQEDTQQQVVGVSPTTSAAAEA